MPETKSPTAAQNALRLEVHRMLAASEAALRLYANGHPSPDLAREMADTLAKFAADAERQRAAVEAFSAGFIIGKLTRPTDTMIEAGVGVLEATGEVDADELVESIVEAVVRQGVIEAEHKHRKE
jgi:hypothetical protein